MCLNGFVAMQMFAQSKDEFALVLFGTPGRWVVLKGGIGPRGVVKGYGCGQGIGVWARDRGVGKG